LPDGLCRAEVATEPASRSLAGRQGRWAGPRLQVGRIDVFFRARILVHLLAGSAEQPGALIVNWLGIELRIDHREFEVQVANVGACPAFKAILAAEIIKALDPDGLSVRGAHSRTGIAATDFSRIRKADLGRFTVDRHETIINRIGSRVEMKVRVRRAERLAHEATA